MVRLHLQQIQVPPGQQILLVGVNWPDFEAILNELGEHRSSRMSYYQGTLEIMTPLPEHERVKVILGDLLKVLMDELNLNWESLGSTTFKGEKMGAGIEPDDCFYLQNYALMIGKDRIDLSVDPPPDLAIEVDVTSQTNLKIYEALQVPEVWRYEQGKITIYLLQEGKYIESDVSANFNNFPIRESISQFLEMSKTRGTTQTLRAFRQWVREQLKI
ncbi:protein of unknown function DUF820 [Gloeothece citriformis PCC 7424]|uniref:Putative restriction endonuclease domain-containing protein n=1 Tax=Gloeothece citriformis (strain PCC 7424) TaxID=65393 RepID=B7KCZ6_GLOC7|nr:Uma2 family endonuclease [Gloeothece citriformis]ACK73117.1 protein of unknown function DUF820 [Gloeothece citriformis PCC 7424]